MKSNRVQISITMPKEVLEILDAYCKYHGMKRSSGLAYLLVTGLCTESYKTNGFDFDTPYHIDKTEDGTIVIKRSELVNLTSEWIFSLNKGNSQSITVSSGDFEE